MNTEKDPFWHVYTLGILTFPYTAWAAISIGIHTGNLKWAGIGFAALVGSFLSVRAIIFADTVCKEGNCSISVRKRWVDISIALLSFLAGGFVALVTPGCKECLYAGTVPIFLILMPLFVWLKPWPKTKQSLYRSAEIILILAPFLLQVAVSWWLLDGRYRSVIAAVSVAYAGIVMQQDAWDVSPFEIAKYMALAGGVLVGGIVLSPLVLQRPVPRLQYIESIIVIPLGAVAFTLIGFLERLERGTGKL